MTINSSEFTVRITVDSHDAETARSLFPASPVRESSAENETTHTFYFEVSNECSENFEASLQSAVSTLETYLLPLANLNNVASELWCIIFSGAEYAGLVMPARVMFSLGERNTNFYLSVYNELT